MRASLILLFALSSVLAIPGLVDVAGAQLIVAVVPDLPGTVVGDEGFAVGCPIACDLTDYSVSDGESEWTFPAGVTLPAGGVLWVVGNRTHWDAHGGPHPVLAVTGLPRLGNDGDDLTLIRPDGAVVDEMAYGKDSAFSSPASPGLILRRLSESGMGGSAAGGAAGGVDGAGSAGPWQDTDSADDWRTPRLHRIGESNLPRPTFEVQRLTLYASPDSSFQVLTDLAASARHRLHLHVYQLRSAALADALVDAKRATPGLDLQVLADSNPVGMGAADRHATADALRRVQSVGGNAVLAGNGRYDDHHLKVLIADDAVAVQSENWVPSGVPQDSSWGNRGWGIVVHDGAMADWFAQWMAADRASWEAQPFNLSSFDPAFTAPARQAPRSGSYGPLVAPLEATGRFRVTPVVAPDHTQDPRTDPIAALAAQATRRLDVQQLDLSASGRNKLGWTGSDPLLDAIAAASRRGAAVRVMVAAPFSMQDTGNQEALEWLEDAGRGHGSGGGLAAPGIEGRVFDRAGMVLHNKGFVADGAVVVGSLNGNLHSRAQNREVSLIVESSAAADYFAALFEGDWQGQAPPRDWSVPVQDLRGLPLAPWPILLAILGVVASRGRWS